MFCRLLLLRFRLQPASWSTLRLWNRLLLRRNPGSPSRAPSRAPWPAALNVRYQRRSYLIRPFVSCDLHFNIVLVCFFFHPACEDALTPSAVADSAVKVLNSCLATMPAGRAEIRLQRPFQKHKDVWNVGWICLKTKQNAEQYLWVIDFVPEHALSFCIKFPFDLSHFGAAATSPLLNNGRLVAQNTF